MKKSLRQRGDDMQTVSDMAGIILLACDVDQKITFINKKGCEIMGHKGEEIIGRKLFETLFFDRVGKREKATFKKAMKKGAESTEWNFEGHISTTKGEERIIVWHNTVLTDERGEKIGILCLGKDTTEKKRMEEKLLAINRLNYRISQTFNIGEIANIILDEAEKVLTFLNTDIFILDDKKQEISTVARRGSLEKGDVLRLPLDGKGITAACAREGRTIYVPDVREDERYIKESESTLSELSVPLKVQERTIGVFDIEGVSPNGFTREDIILAETLASSAAIAIQNAQLFTQAQLEIGERKQAEQIQSMLYKIANATNTTKDLEDLYKSIRSILGTIMDTTNFAIALYDKKTDTISSPYLEDEKDKFGKFPAGKTLTAYVIRKSESLLATEEIKKKLIREGEYEPLGTSSKIWLGVPLKIGKEVIGAITVQSYAEASLYTKKDLRILEFVSDQIAVAIERKWIEEKLAAIYNLSREISLSLDLNEISERVLNACEKVLDFQIIGLYLIDEKKGDLYVSASRGYPEEVRNYRLSLKEDKGITVWSAKHGESIVIPNVLKDPRYVRGDPKLKSRSELAVPLKIGEEVIGVLNIESEKLDAFSESDRRLLETLANQTAIAMQNARLYKEIQGRVEQLAIINRIAKAAGAKLRLEDLMETVYQEIANIFQADAFFIALYDERTKEMYVPYTVDEGIKGPAQRFPLGEGPTSKVFTEKKPLIIRDFKKEYKGLSQTHLFGTMKLPISWLGVPMVIGDRITGVIGVQSYRPYTWDEDDKLLLFTIVDQIAVALENARLFEETQREISERKQAEQIQSVLYKITNATNTTKDLSDLFKSIQDYLSTIVDTTNFAIALYNKETDTISLPHHVDEKDTFTSFPAGKSLSAHVIKRGKPILFTQKEIERLIGEGELEPVGAPSKVWLGAPLKIGNEVMGVVAIQSYTDASLYTEKDLKILEFVSGQIATAIERKRIEERLSTIYNLSRDISLSLDLNKIFEKVMDACEKVLDFRFVALLLIDEKKNELSTVAVKGFRENVVNIRFSLKEDYGITTWVAKNGKTIYVTDVSKDSRYAKADSKVKSELTVPLKIGEKTIGVLNAESEKLDGFSEGDRILLETLANQTAIAIQNAQLYEQAQSEISERKQAEQIQSVLHKIANAANMAEDLSDLFASIQNHLGTIVDTTNFYIALYSKETDAISIPYHFDERDSATSFPAGKSLTSYVIKNDKPLLVTWRDIEKLIGAGEIEPVGTPSKVWLGVPLKIGKEVIGAVVVQSYTDVSLYTEKDLKILEFVSGQIAIAIERKRAEEALKESKNKIEQLHIVAAQMEAAQSEEEIYRLVMDAAGGILDFSQASIQYVEDDYLKIAVTTEKNVPEDYKMSIHEGLGGKTVRTGKSYLVSDAAKDNDAKPTDEEFRSILSVPIGSFGVFQAFSYKVGSFTEGDLKLTELLVSHLVEALKRIKSEEALKASKNKIKQLHKVAARMEAAQTEDEVCHLAIDAAGRILDFITASIQHVEDDYLKIKIATEENVPEDYRMSINEGIGGKTYKTGKSYLIDDITKDKDAKPTDDTYRSVISVPIGDYGVFQTHSNRISHFTNEDLELAELLMSHVNEALKRIKSEEALRKSKDKIEQLHRISARMEAVQTEEEVYCLTIEVAERILRFAICDVSIVEGDWFVVKCASSNQPAGTSRNMSLNEGIIGETYRTGKSCLIKDMREVERAKPVQSELRSLLSIPIGTVGIFQAASAQVGAFEKEDLELAELLMSHVTEALKRIQSGKVIRDSEERYRTLFDNIADPVMVFDQETHLIMDCNSSFIKRYGYALDELRQMNPYHLHPPEDLKTVQENIDDKENFAPHTYTHMTKGGEKFPVEVFTQELEYKGRKAWISIMRDITERRKAEEALRRSEERYRGILEKMEECYYELDLAGNLTFFNPITLKMFGYNSSEELLGLNYKQYTDKENAEKLFHVYHQVFLTGKPAQFEFELKNKDGRTMVMESSISLKKDEEGKPVGFRGVTRDITERKRAEEALLESEERFRNLFENAVLGVYRTTPDGQILMANPALIKMMGYSSFDELALRDLEKEGFESEHPREEFKTMMEKVGEVKGLESAWIKHDGSVIFVRENAKAIQGEEGKILYYEGTVEDITESRRAEERQAIVYRIADATNKSTNLWELSKFIHHEIGAIIDARNFYISLYDASQKLITFPYYIDENYADHTRPSRKFGKGLTEYVITSGKALLATNEKMEQMSREGKIESVGTPSSVWLGVPLTTKGKTFGVMAVQSYKDSNIYTQNDLKFMEYVSDQIAIVIERKVAEEKLSAIYDLSREITLTMDVDKIFEKAMDACQRVLDFKIIGIFLLDEGKRELYLKTHKGYPEEAQHLRFSLEGEKGITTWVAKHGESLLVPDVSLDPRFVIGESSVRSELAVPIKVGEKVIGVLNVESEKFDGFSDEDRKLLETLASQAAVAIENAKLYVRIKETSDYLTNIVESASDGIIAADMEGKILTFNRSAEVIFGYDASEVVGTNVRHYYPEGVAHDIMRRIRESEDKRIVDYEILAVGKGGERIPLSLSASLLCDHKREPIGSIGVFRDLREKKKNEEKLAAIYDLSREMSLSLNLDSVFEKVLDACEEVLDFEMIGLYIIDEMSRELCVRSSRGYPEEVMAFRLPLDGERGITVWVANHKQPLIVSDVSQDPRYVSGSEQFHNKSELAVPLMVSEKVIGVLNIESEKLNAFSEDDKKLLETLANQAAIAIQNAQLYEQAQSEIAERKQAENRQAVAYRIADAANRATNLEELFECIRDELGHIIDTTNFYIALYNAFNNEITFPYYIDEKDSPEVIQTLHREYGEGLTESIIENGKAAIFYEDDLKQRKSIGFLARIWLGVPLITRGNTIGVMAVQSYSDPHAYTQEDLEFMEFVSSQIAIVIERKRSEEKLAAIYDLSREMSLSLNLDSVFEKVFDACEEVLDFKMINLFLIDEMSRELCVRASRGYPEEVAYRFPLDGGRGITVWVANHKQPLIVSDVSQDPRYVSGTEHYNKSELAVPLMVGEKVIGVLNIESKKLNAFSEDDKKLLETLANQAAIAIENARLFEETQREIAERKKAEEKLSAIHRMAEKLALAPDTDKVVNTTLEIAQDILEFKNCAIALLDKEKQELHIKAQTGFPENLELLKIPLKGKGITAWVANNGQSLLVPDVSTDERYIEWTTNIRSELCVPLKVKDEVIGILNVESEKLNTFSTNDQMLLETLASEAAIALENASLFEREREAALQIEFLNDLMSHDINNLNQISLGYLELLRNLGLTEKQRMFAEKALNSVKSSAQLVENVKKLQKLKGGEIKLEKLNLKDILLEVIPEISHRADKNVDVTFSPHDIWISGTPLLKDVFFNLMDNAIKYTLSHDVRIEVCVQELDDSIRVCIKDWGSGIPDEMKTKIFDRFERIGKGVKGSGLGLYIVKMIVTKLSGKIWVEDNPEGGSVFCVEFPGVAK